MARLNDIEIATYHGDGLVVPNYSLPKQQLEALSGAVSELVAANPDVPPEYLVGPHIERPEDRIPGLHRKFLDLCTDSEILDMVQDLIGADIILWSSGVFCKPPVVGRTVPWHQDGQYWPIRPLAVCSVWIAIDDATPNNGCMRYLPGSHRERRLWCHEHAEGSDLVLNQQVSEELLDLDTARDDVLRAGQMSMHDVFLVHGSNANTSGERRAGYVMRYMPGTSLYDRAMSVGESSDIGTSDFGKRPIWLVRGCDRTGRNDFRTGHRNVPDSEH